LRIASAFFVVLVIGSAAVRADDSVDRSLRHMSLEHKVGQMIMTSVTGKQLNSTTRRFIDDVKPGGVTLFGYNIKTPQQLREFNGELYRQLKQSSGGIVPFIAIDQEGGLVTRLREQVAVLPGNMALGATRSTKLARRAGAVLARGLRDYGFNMNLAPVLDINSNPMNPVIGLRSYSSDPVLVSRMGSAFIKGLQSQQIVAVGKHFPGHGDSFGDSHARLPVVDQNLKTLEQRELIPFRYAFENGLDVVMTAHIALPALHQGRNMPATLSPLVLNQLLRKQLDFKGIIMTDGLEMKGLLKSVGNLGRAAVLAVRAGADVLTINADPAAARSIQRALLRAVDRGELSVTRIDQSVRRILQVKQRHGLLTGDHRTRQPGTESMSDYESIAREIAANGVTIVRNRHQVLPVLPSQVRTLWLVGDRIQVDYYRGLFSGIRIRQARLDSRQDLLSLARHLRAGDEAAVVLAHKRRTILQAEQLARQSGGKVVLINSGSPYLVRQGVNVDAILCTYSSMDPAIRIAFEVIAGRRGAPGRLPVHLSRRYPFGYPASTLGQAQTDH
jgi:beta-N-acetylhexosaminidase